MALRSISTFLIIIALTACSEPTKLSLEQQIIEDAANAMGGRDTIANITTLSIEATGTLGNLGQDLTNETAGQFFKISEYIQTNNLNAKQMQIKFTQTPDYLYFRGPDPMNVSIGIDNDISYNIGANGSASRSSEAQTTDRRHLYYHHPLKLIQAFLLSNATISNGRTENGESTVDISPIDGLKFTLSFDTKTHLPSKITSIENHPVLRDVAMTTRYMDYQQVDGLNLPNHIIQTIDDFEQFNLTFTTQSANSEIADITTPNDAMAPRPINPPSEITAEKIADNIWLLAGGYNSLVVEFSDHLVLFESPSEDRGLAVIAKARTLVPGKPLTHVVNTHHHFDHSGGIRAAIAEGLTIITQSANEAFYKSLAKRTSLIVPDALSQNPMDANIVAIENTMTYEDDTMKVEFYHIKDSPHASSLLMAYFPEQKIIYEADVFSSAASYHPFAAQFSTFLEGLNLDIERIVPVHGPIATYDDLDNVVNK